jgi:hypothetical protein
MSNPTISFRISTYQLARGLQIIHRLEPNYQLTSISQIVRTIYLDYLAKMSLNKSDTVLQQYLEDINNLLAQKKHNNPTIRDIYQITNDNNEQEESIINSVTDFSPPADWLEQD